MESMKTYGLGVEDSLVSGLLLGSNNSTLAPTWASHYSHLMHIKRDPRYLHYYYFFEVWCTLRLFFLH
jgi:hypothetical protein